MAANSADKPERSALVRGLGLWSATVIVIGDTIDTGVFLVASDMARAVGSATLVLVAWILGGLIVLLGAFCYAELGAAQKARNTHKSAIRQGSSMSLRRAGARSSILNEGTAAADQYCGTSSFKPSIISKCVRFLVTNVRLLISMFWEATLAVPYGWWGYQQKQMLGLSIGAWAGLPIEAVTVWIAVTYGTTMVF